MNTNVHALKIIPKHLQLSLFTLKAFPFYTKTFSQHDIVTSLVGNIVYKTDVTIMYY